jgi:hypothetical protein
MPAMHWTEEMQKCAKSRESTRILKFRAVEKLWKRKVKNIWWQQSVINNNNT